jgi:rhodanese-related sulfurtransferase
VPEQGKLIPLTASQTVEEQRKGALILDTRPAREFAATHIQGSIQIGLVGPFSSWAAMLLKPDQKLAIIAENVESAEEARIRLARVGFKRVIGYSLADETRWRNEGIHLATISIRRKEDVQPALARDPSLQVIDVRSRAEWLKGHLPGAISAPLLDFESNAQVIDRSKPSLVYCHAGFRATTAVSILLRESSNDIEIMIDGFEGWSASGLPCEILNTGKLLSSFSALTASQISPGSALIDL